MKRAIKALASTSVLVLSLIVCSSGGGASPSGVAQRGQRNPGVQEFLCPQLPA